MYSSVCWRRLHDKKAARSSAEPYRREPQERNPAFDMFNAVVHSVDSVVHVRSRIGCDAAGPPTTWVLCAVFVHRVCSSMKVVTAKFQFSSYREQLLVSVRSY